MVNLKIADDCQIPGLFEIYKKYLPSNGFFVEVGAYDGNSWSNTSGLADIGWGGLYIEPIPEFMAQCKERHKNNKVFFEQVAIGNKIGTRSISVAGGLTTLHEQTHVAHGELFKFDSEKCKTHIVPVLTLDSILRKNKVQKNFDLLVVDVEGLELEVFESFSFADYSPLMIIAELCDIHGSYNKYEGLQKNARIVREHILKNQYTQIYADAINTIFIRKSNEQL